jgi:hypothetical protein
MSKAWVSLLIVLLLSGLALALTQENIYIIHHDNNVYLPWSPIGEMSGSVYSFVGSNCSGGSGSVNRVLVSGLYNISLVIVDNQYLHPLSDYNESGGNITFFNPLWDDMSVTVWAESNEAYYNYLGSDCTLGDGDKYRVLNAGGGVVMVAVDNQALQPGIDYTYTNTSITFLNPLWNDMRITIWR